MENQAIAKAELDLAKQTLEEHTIVAPFDGIIIKRMKHPGESVRASDAVVELGNLNRLCANAYVPLEYAYRVKEGQIVEIQPRITACGGGEPLPIEKKRFRGKITFVDPQIQPVAETAVRIRAEFENPRLRAAAGPEGADDDLLDHRRRGRRPEGPQRPGPAATPESEPILGSRAERTHAVRSAETSFLLTA